jgi:4-amino-4-deoxy-L-arabinose transferase-like glycosyltransferase
MALNRLAVWLLGLVVVLRVATLGLYPLTDSTEARYAEMARKMLDTGNWLTPMIDTGVPFWGKPPLSMWLSAAGQALVGVGELGARLGPFFATLVVLGLLACWRGRERFGWVAALVLLSSPLGFIASGAVMTDMTMVAGTTLSMVAFWRAWLAGAGAAGEAQAPWWPWLFFAGQGIGLMAKGPVAVVLSGVALGGWLVLTCWRDGIAATLSRLWCALPWLRGMLLLAVLVVPWYALAEQATPGFLRYFLVGEHWQRFTQTGWKGDLYGVAHAQPKGRIWLFAVLCTLPWLLAGFWWAWQGRNRRGSANGAVKGVARWVANGVACNVNATPYLLAWAVAPCVFFTMSGNILPAYVLPGLPAFALLVARLACAQAPSVRTTAWLLSLSALATPLAFTALVTLDPGRLASYSDEALWVKAQAALGTPGKTDPQGPLVVYLFDRTDSGVFYTKGLAALAKTPEAIHRAVGDAVNPSPYAVLLLPHVHVVRWHSRLAEAGWTLSGRNSLNVAYIRKATASPPSSTPLTQDSRP